MKNLFWHLAQIVILVLIQIQDGTVQFVKNVAETIKICFIRIVINCPIIRFVYKNR